MKTATLKQAGKVIQMISDKGTPDEQLQWVLASGALSDLLDANPKGFDREAFRKFLGLKSLNPPILQFVAEFTVPARTARFIPKKAYIVNTKPGPHVKIAYVDPDFMAGSDEEVEEPTTETTLRYYVLTRPSVFASAIKEIRDGGIGTKTTRGELFSMLERQPDGPNSGAGPLLTNGYANLFEMVLNGVLCAVGVCWYADGWFVLADPVTDPAEWRVGLRVFSRSSRLPSVALLS